MAATLPRSARGRSPLGAAASILRPPSAGAWADPAAMAEQLAAGAWYRAPHLSLLAEELVALLDTPGGRLIVTMPPQHGKTELTSRWLPVWALEREPSLLILLASYGAEYAARHGRWVRNAIRQHERHLRVRVAEDSSAADRWATTAGGGMTTAGVGGGITGLGGDLIVIDDPVKDRAEAESAAYRRAAWDWYRDTLSTRLRPGAAIVLVMTRWHRQDLAGQLLAEAEGEGEPWRVVHLPAIAGAGDPLGRPVGAALWPERYPLPVLEATRRRLGPYGWSSLYQGNPRPRGGGAFWADDALEDARRRAPRAHDGTLAADLVELVISLDPSASSAPGSDEAGIVAVGRDRQGRAGVMADHSGVMAPDEWGRRSVELYRELGAGRIIVEANQGGDMAVSVIRTAARALGVPMPRVRKVHARVGKALRAEPVSQLYAEGLVWHAAPFPDLEEQMVGWTPESRDSPDRLDAMVHGVTELLLARPRTLVTR